VDLGLLKETAEPAREILDVETINVIADRNYFKSEDIEGCEKGRLRDMQKVDYANVKACRDCSRRPRCANKFRAVSRLENEDVVDRRAARLRQRPDILARRQEMVEHPFGTIKQRSPTICAERSIFSVSRR
jgi:hypothetical protein